MLKVYFTVDVELWCDGWNNIDSKFHSAFKRHIYGSTKQGDYGLPYQLKVLNDYGLAGVFFVEPLFSLRFGSDPLEEVVGLVLDANQQVDLHLHTEWVDEAIEPLFPYIEGKRQHLKHFSLSEQKILVGVGKKLLGDAGANEISAFRAGSFGFNLDTLSALQHNDIYIDSSYNAVHMGLDSGLMLGEILTEPLCYDRVHEVPMTVYFDRPGNLRHTQLCACSTRELEGILWQALEECRESVVILSHSFEMLDKTRTRPSAVVVNRFKKLCEFLDNNRDSFSVEIFSGFSGSKLKEQPAPLSSPVWKTGLRMIEQVRCRYL